jgi:dihydrodipicolinate synthase/N-acetylneuraminate lyase
MSKPNLRGIYAMLVTPFNKNEDVDYEAMRAEVDWCAAQGVQGVVATPSIGEFACLTNQERWKCFEVVSDQAKKYPQLTKIATVAATHSREVVEHCKVAKELGFAAAQLVPPYYWMPDEDEVYRHYQVACDTGLPVVVYHNPALSKFYMRREFLGKLSELPGVVGIKEVKTDRHIELEPLYKAVAGRVPIFHTFRVFTTGLILGSAGGFINAFAIPACMKLWKLWNEKGDRVRMEEIQNMINEVFMRGAEDNKRHIGTTKMCTSAVTGINMGAPRAPYLALGAEAEAKFRQKLPALEALLR